MRSINLLPISCLVIACTFLPGKSSGQSTYPNTDVVRASEAPAGRVSAAAYYMAYRPQQKPSNIRARRTMVTSPNGQPARRKPFDDVTLQPTLSPYLNLDLLEENENSVPNYHIFVRPQLNQRTEIENQARAKREQQKRARTLHSRRQLPSVPTTGSNTAQFLNTGSYFPPIRR